MKQLCLLAATVIVSVSGTAFAKASIEKSHPIDTATKQQQLLLELTGRDESKISDIQLYAQIVGAYDSRDEISFKSRMQSFMHRFPHSPYADNVLYLAGMMAVNNVNYPEAVRFFSRVEKEYPTSDKVTAATFAKGMTYKKMNLESFAKQILTQVKSKFPGSPESFRAEVELKMIK
jgi:TolA-binding protein